MYSKYLVSSTTSAMISGPITPLGIRPSDSTMVARAQFEPVTSFVSSAKIEFYCTEPNLQKSHQGLKCYNNGSECSGISALTDSNLFPEQKDIFQISMGRPARCIGSFKKEYKLCARCFMGILIGDKCLDISGIQRIWKLSAKRRRQTPRYTAVSLHWATSYRVPNRGWCTPDTRKSPKKDKTDLNYVL